MKSKTLLILGTLRYGNVLFSTNKHVKFSLLMRVVECSINSFQIRNIVDQILGKVQYDLNSSNTPSSGIPYYKLGVLRVSLVYLFICFILTVKLTNCFVNKTFIIKIPIFCSVNRLNFEMALISEPES